MALISYFNEIDQNYKYYRVHIDDYEKYHDCALKISLLLEKGKPIPSKLFKEYDSYMQEVDFEREKYYRTKIKQVTDNIFKLLEGREGFIFSAKYESTIPIKYQQLYDLDALVKQTVSHLIDIHDHDIIMNNKSRLENKKSVLFYIIDFMDGFFCCIPQSMRYNKYRKYAFAGYVAHGFGFTLTTKTLSVENMHSAVHSLLKYQPVEKKKPATKNS